MTEATKMERHGMIGGSDRLDGQVKALNSIIDIADQKVEAANDLKTGPRRKKLAEIHDDLTEVLRKQREDTVKQYDASIEQIDRGRSFPEVPREKANRIADVFDRQASRLTKARATELIAQHRLQDSLKNPSPAAALLVDLAASGDLESVNAVTNALPLERKAWGLTKEAIDVARERAKAAAYPGATAEIEQKRKELSNAQHNLNRALAVVADRTGRMHPQPSAIATDGED